MGLYTTRPHSHVSLANHALLQVVAASRWNLSPFGILLRCMYEQEAGVAHTLSMQVRSVLGALLQQCIKLIALLRRCHTLQKMDRMALFVMNMPFFNVYITILRVHFHHQSGRIFRTLRSFSCALCALIESRYIPAVTTSKGKGASWAC